MSTRAQHVRLGLFLVLFVVVLVGGIAALAGTRMWERRDVYTIRFDESVAGLEIGAPVKVNGVRVGRVDGIDLDERDINHVVVTISLRGGIPLRRDAEALVQLQGITGLRFVDVSPGSRGQSLLPPGSEIPTGASEIGLWTGRAEDFYAQLQQLAARLMRLTSDDNLTNVQDILRQTNEMTAAATRLARRLDELIDENRTELAGTVREFRRAGASVATAGDELAQAARTTREGLGSTLGAGRRTLAKIDSLAESGTRGLDSAGALIDDARGSLTEERMARVMDSLVEALQALSQTARSLQLVLDRSGADLTATLGALRAASEQLEDFSRTIRDNPGALLRRGGLPEEEVPR